MNRTHDPFETDLATTSWQHFVKVASTPVASTLGLSKLPDYAGTILLSASITWATHTIFGPLLSKTLFPKSYGRLVKSRDRNNWNGHLVAFLHSVVISPLAWNCLDVPSLDQNRAFGWDARVGQLCAIASGYFLWDTCESLYHFQDVGFVLHGLSCFLIFIFGFTPFLLFYGARFLLWELSTPFLNIHWFLDKLDMTGSTLQLVNGVILCTTFAGCRLVYGTIMSYQFFNTMLEIKDDVPLVIILLYTIGNVLLNGLNWYWFYKMISSLQKRMQSNRPIDAVSKTSVKKVHED